MFSFFGRFLGWFDWIKVKKILCREHIPALTMQCVMLQHVCIVALVRKKNCYPILEEVLNYPLNRNPLMFQYNFFLIQETRQNFSFSNFVRFTSEKSMIPLGLNSVPFFNAKRNVQHTESVDRHLLRWFLFHGYGRKTYHKWRKCIIE